MKLESQKDMDPLKNKNMKLNTIGRTESSEDEESEDNQLTDLTDSSDIDNLESQFTDKLQINKLTLSSYFCFLVATCLFVILVSLSLTFYLFH